MDIRAPFWNFLSAHNLSWAFEAQVMWNIVYYSLSKLSKWILCVVFPCFVCLLIDFFVFKFAFAFVIAASLHDEAILSHHEPITIVNGYCIFFNSFTEWLKALVTLKDCFVADSVFIVRVMVIDLLLTRNLYSWLKLDFAAFNWTVKCCDTDLSIKVLNLFDQLANVWLLILAHKQASNWFITLYFLEFVMGKRGL